MTRIKATLVILLGCAAVIAGNLTGCANRLEPGGAYAPVNVTTNTDGSVEVTPTQQADMPLFIADSTFELAYSGLDAAFRIERDNRALLWSISPDIKHELDKVRVEAAGVKVKWALARQEYLRHPVPANLDALQTVLAEIQRLNSAATAVLPKD